MPLVFSDTDTRSYTINTKYDATWARIKCVNNTESNFHKEYLSTYWDETSTSTSAYNISNIIRDATATNTMYVDATSMAYREAEFFANSATNTFSLRYATDGLTWEAAPLAPGDRIRQIIRDRMGPAIHRKRTSMQTASDIREERARDTLRRIIGHQAFKRFIRDGFITVRPKSGLIYRIYPGYGITDVFDKGIMVDRLCVVLSGNFPPTDSLLMRYLLILNDEGEFSKYAVQHGVPDRSRLVFPTQKEVKPLTEAWAKLKVA